MTYFAMVEVLPGALIGALLGSKSMRETTRRALVWGAGCAIPLAGWGVLILRSPEAFQDQFLKHVSDISRLGGAEPHYLNLFPVREGPAEPWSLGSFERILSHWTHFEIMPLGFFAFVLGTAISLAAGWDAGVEWIHSRWARVFFIATPLSFIPIPLARAVATLTHWQARSGEPLNELVKKDIPRGVPVAGIPAAYFAAVANGNDYYYSTPLTGLLVFPQPGDVPQFAATMEKVRPQYLLVDPGFDPLTAPGLPRHARYERVDHFAPPSVNVGSIRRTGYDIVVWKVVYD
jgi:hypothetical protein